MISMLNKLLRNERGNIATMTAFLIIPMAVLVGGVINFGMAWTVKNQLQVTADASALAGASQLGNDENVVAEANDVAGKNMPSESNGDVLADPDIEIGLWDEEERTFTAGGTPENAVRATTRRSDANGNAVASFLGGIVGLDDWNLSATAIAAMINNQQGCFLALDSTGAAFSMSGNSTLTLNGCSVMSNSTANPAFSIGGSARATMECAMAAGGMSIAPGSLTQTDCTQTMDHVDAIPDPYDDLPEPPVPSGSCKSLPSGQGAATIPSGKYCVGSLKGTKTFETGGTFIIEGGKNGGALQISANANVTGTDVTFFFTNNATFDANANGTVNLSAPTTGPYAGMLFWGDDSNSSGTNTFNGTPTSRLTGIIYFPGQRVSYLGNFSGDNGCMRVVAKTIEFTGNATINATCPELAGIPLTHKLALVD